MYLGTIMSSDNSNNVLLVTGQQIIKIQVCESCALANIINESCSS